MKKIILKKCSYLKKKGGGIAISILFSSLFICWHINILNATPTKTYPKILRVAHAGGGYSGITYTNSLDALNFNKQKYDLFELDFVFTSDWELICLHDWEESVKITFDKNFQVTPPTLKEFNLYVDANTKYKNCTFNTLVTWLNSNPDKIIVTDIKDNNIKALEYIAKRYPDYSKRFIPQIYFPEEYELVKNMGYEKIIWTLYRFSGDSKLVLHKVKSMHLYAITMPPSRVDTGLAKELRDSIGIRSYVHTINDQKKLQKYENLGIYEIYTDFLSK